MRVIDPNKIQHIGSDPRNVNKPKTHGGKSKHSIDWYSDRVNNFYKIGSGYKGECPLHSDTSLDSLSLKEDGDETLIYCFAGCNWREIEAHYEGVEYQADIAKSQAGQNDSEEERKASRICDNHTYEYEGVVKPLLSC